MKDLNIEKIIDNEKKKIDIQLKKFLTKKL